MDQDFSFLNKLQRVLSSTKLVGSLATKMAGKHYFGLDFDLSTHAKDLKEVLGELRGPIMKIAQIISTIPGVIPNEYAIELAKLQNQAPKMGWLFVKRRMRSELGSNWLERFSMFNQEAHFAASIGQVHKATILQDGQEITLACKLQYPSMDQKIQLDIAQLKVLLKLYGGFTQVVSTENILEEINNRITQELDYLQEAQNIEVFRKVLQNNKSINVPKAFHDLSTKKLLSMEWLEGVNLKEWCIGTRYNPTDANTLAKEIFYGWYYPLYHSGVLHGDPHLGNYSITSDNCLNLMDFGCVRHFSPQFLEGIKELFYGLLKDNHKQQRRAYEMWGFKGINDELIKILNLWARFVFDPLLDNNVRKINKHHFDGDGKSKNLAVKLFMQIHKELKKHGQLIMPQEFIILDRATVGVGAAAMILNAELNWHQLFMDIILNSQHKDSR